MAHCIEMLPNYSALYLELESPTFTVLKNKKLSPFTKLVRKAWERANWCVCVNLVSTPGFPKI